MKSDVELAIKLLRAAEGSDHCSEVVGLVVKILERCIGTEVGEEENSSKPFRSLLNEHFQKYKKPLHISALETPGGYNVDINGTTYQINSKNKKTAVEEACERFYYKLANNG